MNSGPSGFHNAPVTKALVLTCGLISFLPGPRRVTQHFALSYEAFVNRGEIWRLFTSCLAFQSMPETLFGLYLLYYFRVFERQLGHSKYAVFVVFVALTSSAFQALLLLLLPSEFASQRQQVSSMAPGPYGVIFGSLVSFILDIPACTHFSVFSLSFTDKSFIYLAALQLMVSSWKRSLIPAVAGLLSGLLYRSNILSIRALTFPEWVTSSLSRILSSPFGTAPTATRSQRVQQLQGEAAAAGGGGLRTVNNGAFQFPAAAQRPFPTVVRALPPPPESAIAALEAMGFGRTEAMRALAQAGNDITLATNILLESSSAYGI
eukprot:TRINITY_DN18590_c0_g1_i1.p1 TRINITY_DN18590_c0_g1~~TRINITY_DN18590_c0_g1_i1.p1  ORF type:complete len:320 (+),score=81.81 TRINITY_DN18590_c0_g1_i1:127-1086(+)